MNGLLVNIKALSLMLLISLFSFCDLEAQSVNDTIRHRPTVGVVLCGGGANGFAHIRILKMIEEAGVPIDYIAGTSIGSIMGALYAVGYDPDMMEQLVRSQDWNQVIYDKIPKALTPVDQKMNERNYLATFPFSDGKLKVKPSLVEGVYVNLLMSRLMLPADSVEDYNKLTVPFFCIATDVEHACQYEMTHGNLARSVRASMSIPFFFKPVNLDGKVLVDGGMVNNFPVRNMKNRGVDIIIGVDLEDATIPASKIDNSLGLLESMLNLSSLEESIYAKANCDIYIKPNLHGRGMMAFEDFDSILQYGEDAAREFYPQLKILADFLQETEPYEINRPHVQPVENLYITDIDVEGISEKHKSGVVKEFGKSFPREMSLDDIQEVILKLSASGYYEDLWYETEKSSDGVKLKLHCKERADKDLSFCVHYDNNYGIGSLLNFTIKNLWNSMNRTTLTADINIAENPYIKVNLNKRQGRVFRYGAALDVISLKMNQFDNNKITNSYSIQSNSLNLYAQLLPSLTQQIRFGAIADYVHMKDFVGDNGLGTDYSFYTYVYLNYFFGNEDVPNHARRGWRINLTGKCLFFEGENDEGTLSTVESPVSFVIQGYAQKAIPIGEKNSLRLGIKAGTKIGEKDVPLFYKFMIGGQSKMKYYDNIISFTGLNFVNKSVDHMAIGSLAWQWNFYKIFYSVVGFDFGYMSDVYDMWFDSNSFVAGAGVTFGADTVIGPIEVSLMGSNVNSSAVGFVNVGYWF